MIKYLVSSKKSSTFAADLEKSGAIAQLVEQRTENPCVPGSIPGGTTAKKDFDTEVFFCFSSAFFVEIAGFEPASKQGTNMLSTRLSWP